MLLLRCLLWSTAIFASILAAQTQPEPVNRSGIVQIRSVSKVLIGNERPAYLVSYSYAFVGLSQVHVKGLGVVPSVGMYQYITTDQELEFRDSGTGILL